MFSLKKGNIILLIKQHRDILIFVLVVVSFHTFWKIGREADDADQIIHFYGINFSPLFMFISDVWTNLVYRFTVIFKGDVLELFYCNLHYADTDTGIRIVWGCSGIKEVIMTILVLVTAKGDIHKKLWYIPLGVIYILILNFIRLATLTFLVHHHSEYFDFVHGIVFRGVMYGGIFLIWLVWIEKVKSKKLKADS